MWEKAIDLIFRITHRYSNQDCAILAHRHIDLWNNIKPIEKTHANVPT